MKSAIQSGVGTNEGKGVARGAPVQPLASSPRPWRNTIDAGEAEGLGAGMVKGGSLDMVWENGFPGCFSHTRTLLSGDGVDFRGDAFCQQGRI